MMARSPRCGGRFGEREHLVGHAVRGQHLCLVCHAELGEHLDRLAHRGPVAARPHHDGHHCVAHRASLPDDDPQRRGP
jgi:hypothetical protein